MPRIHLCAHTGIQGCTNMQHAHDAGPHPCTAQGTRTCTHAHTCVNASALTHPFPSPSEHHRQQALHWGPRARIPTGPAPCPGAPVLPPPPRPARWLPPDHEHRLCDVIAACHCFCLESLPRGLYPSRNQGKIVLALSLLKIRARGADGEAGTAPGLPVRAGQADLVLSCYCRPRAPRSKDSPPGGPPGIPH